MGFKKTISIKEASKLNWTVESETNYPGDRNIELGCLMRIADATEAMAKNHTQLLNDLENHKRWYNQEREENKTLRHSNRSLRGVITKLKRK